MLPVETEAVGLQELNVVDLAVTPPYSRDCCWDGYSVDGGSFDTVDGGGKDGTVPVVIAVFTEQGSHGSLRAAGVGVSSVSILLLVVVVEVTVDKKVVGGAAVLNGKLSLLVVLFCVPVGIYVAIV